MVGIFYSLNTQWIINIGMSGAFWQGLDYTRVEALFRLLGISRKRWPELLLDLRIMEAAALEGLN